MITKTLKASIALVAFASISFAGAQERLEVNEDKSAKMFKHLDVNADEKISLEEYKAQTVKDPSKELRAEKRFAKMDTNEDGFVDRAEYKIAFDAPKSPNQIKKNVTKG